MSVLIILNALSDQGGIKKHKHGPTLLANSLLFIIGCKNLIIQFWIFLHEGGFLYERVLLAIHYSGYNNLLLSCNLCTSNTFIG